MPQRCKPFWRLLVHGSSTALRIDQSELQPYPRPPASAGPTQEEFISELRVNLAGYQVNFSDLVAGLFLFNRSCGTSMAVPAGQFQNLYKGPIFEERLTGGEDCPGYCLREDELRLCPAKCECAYVREIIQIIKNWPGHPG